MLKGKVAFVSGGSGAVGSAIAKVLAREGCTVACSYNSNAEKARQLEAELSEAGPKVKFYPLDVRNGPAAVQLAEQVERELGPVDVLVNNAGIAQVMPFALIDEEDWDLTLDVNVKGMFLVTKAFIHGMIRRKRGAIVNVSSLAGLRVLEVPVHYATAKSAAVGFTLSLAREMSRYNIRVNAVVPGMLTAGVSANVPAAQQEQYARFCTLSRAGEPGEVAEVVAFLASDRASYVNAQAIFVDGGI
jgi:3-oxoacyl-[acyl-carrier protein] reductase